MARRRYRPEAYRWHHPDLTKRKTWWGIIGVWLFILVGMPLILVVGLPLLVRLLKALTIMS